MRKIYLNCLQDSEHALTLMQTRLLKNNPRPVTWEDARAIYALAL